MQSARREIVGLLDSRKALYGGWRLDFRVCYWTWVSHVNYCQNSVVGQSDFHSLANAVVLRTVNDVGQSIGRLTGSG
jgi:hypothetical protein